jgi:alpha-tubulin suppressor-like RCC1 family protein
MIPRRTILVFCALGLAACGGEANTTAPVVTEPPPPTFDPAASVVAFREHSCGLTDAGKAFCWGANTWGELGADLNIDDLHHYNWVIPRALPVATGLTFVKLQGGAIFTCGLTAGHELYCWGGNFEGEQGDTFFGYRKLPTRIPLVEPFKDIAANDRNTCGLTLAGAVRCSGAFYGGGIQSLTSGTKVFQSIYQGPQHTCALESSGAAYCWGYGGGRNGDGTGERLYEPTAVAGGLTFTVLALGDSHSCGIDNSTHAYCWGLNADGQLGDESTDSRLSPTLVHTAVPFASIAAGSTHTCAVGVTGEAYCWGANTYGQLGDGTTVSHLAPSPVGGGLHFTSISIQQLHTCGRTIDGKAYCWGVNNGGQLGDSSFVTRNVPVRVLP